MNRMPHEMDRGPEAEGARRATGAFGPTATSAATAPDPEGPAKAQRRRFTAVSLKQMWTRRTGWPWGRCFAEKACIARTWRPGSVSRALAGTTE